MLSIFLKRIFSTHCEAQKSKLLLADQFEINKWSEGGRVKDSIKL